MAQSTESPMSHDEWFNEHRPSPLTPEMSAARKRFWTAWRAIQDSNAEHKIRQAPLLAEYESANAALSAVNEMGR